ncbi:hypothetical protein BDP27DRAFT_1192178, partial [Rhodocollybia butyracea]
LPLAHGYPLWVPEPDEALPSEYQDCGLSIGDVGIITPDGGFDFLFNTFLPADDPINQSHGVPEGFEPLTCFPRDMRLNSHHHRPGIPITSLGTQSTNIQAHLSVDIPGVPGTSAGGGVEVIFSRSSGALLMLPDGAARADYQNISALRQHAAKNAKSWFQFINGPLGRETSSLYLITGHDKTCTWESA